jgi:signal transduction histidine kinase
MNTYFASPVRATPAELASEVEIVSQSPVVTGLLHTVGGLLAVLNEHLQVVALNDSFLQALGIADAKEALGLRMGEAMRCVHACEKPAGCGTTPHCATCGAAIAFVTSLGEDVPAERSCALQASRDGALTDIVLQIRAQVLRIRDRRFILVFAQDVTRQHQWAALERTFFHDINNLLSQLLCASEMLAEASPSELASAIHQAAVRLSQEVAVQRCLTSSGDDRLQASRRPVSVSQTFLELRQFFAIHPVARGKTLQLGEGEADATVETDPALLLRVLSNMIINAFEATKKGDEVKVWAERGEGRLTFCVWNAQSIPPEVALRIFQRNFSTKQQAGRGVGTYSMKLIGERILGGSVAFTSTPEQGTVFRFSLPL